MHNRYVNTFEVSWDKLHKDTRILTDRLVKSGFKFKGIAAITRGGLVPAAIIARELDIRFIETICVVSYDKKEQHDCCSVLKSIEGDGEGWLIVDELVDTGKTAGLIRKMYPKAYIVSVYAKPAGKDTVNDFISEVTQDTWILFPWDKEEPDFSK